MFFDQSKSDKSFNQKRDSSRGAYGKGGGGSAGPSRSPSSSRSVNKSKNNAQGGQSRLNPTPVNSAESNGSHVQPQIQGSDAPVTNATAKPSELSAAQSSTRAVPKAPTSQPPAMSSDPADPTTPAKDASKAFPFQFGSISPGFMNGMAIPARTSSAPPNIDEQKCDQSIEVISFNCLHDHEKCIDAQKAAVGNFDVNLETFHSEDANASKLFPFKFGSISPGFMNGMAIPARTSSAPPNIEEQKHDQIPACTSTAPPNIDEQKRDQSTEVVFDTWTHDHKKCIEAQKKAAAWKSLDVLLDELLSEDDSESILEEKEVPHSPISDLDLDLEPEQWDWNLPELPELSLPELPTWRSCSQSSPIPWDLPWTDEEIRKKDAAITEHILKKEIAG